MSDSEINSSKEYHQFASFWIRISSVFAALIIVLFLYAKNQPTSRLIRGIYRQNESLFYYPKFVFIFLIIKLQNIRKPKPVDDNDLEKPQPLSYHRYAIDAVYFNGSNPNKSVLVCGTARRKNNLVNGFLYLRIPEFSDQLLLTPRLPDTCMRQTEEDGSNFSAEGLKLESIEPMRVWKITYNGQMKLENSETLFPVDLQAQFRGRFRPFKYDTDMNISTTADSIAKEKWTKEYFNSLKEFHQTHYEQYGKIDGVARIDGKNYPFEISSVRDHSFGLQRNWKVFHRYAMHFLTLENGDHITVGVICVPVMFSRIVVGFITKAEENKNYPVEGCDFQLYQHGESGAPPKEYAFKFQANDTDYVVKVNPYLAPEFYLGEEAECRIVEMLCTFEVNGISGWGAAEWQYRHVDGLPK